MSVRIKKFGIAAGLLLALSACLVGGNAVATGKDAAVAKEIQTKLQAEIPNASTRSTRRRLRAFTKLW